MPFCLLTDPWLPVRRRSGALDVIAPRGIAATEPDPVVALTWPRPDFRLASLEFLIGLLATACPPADAEAWDEGYGAPPDAGALSAAFAPYAHAFVLDGDGPRFMQELGDFAADPNPVETLLIEAPGTATTKKNTDLLVRRGRVRTISRAGAAMALFTLQTYAPAGGAGNRTSLRGGGPLTTLALPPRDTGKTLWHLLWANVPQGERASESELPRVFPWLAPTRVSDKSGRDTTPADVHPLQVWWGMPRRIRLDFAQNTNGVVCDLTGRTDAVMVRSWRQRPWGTNYAVWGGLHPLSPCYRMKPGAELLYLHPQPGGIGYQHWLGLLSRQEDPTRQIAPAIQDFRDRVRDIAPGRTVWRLLAAGFDMDNMKARGFTESEIPVVEPRDRDAARAHDELLGQLVKSADIVAGLLRRCVHRALFSDGATVALDAAPLAALRERFWVDTATAFFDLADSTASGTLETDAAYAKWLDTLRRTALALFAEAAPMDASGEGHPECIAAAAKHLALALRGYGKDGAALFGALGMALPEPTAGKGKRTRKEQAA